MLLEVRRLTKRFGGVAAADDLSFDVEEGSITALIGPNGAGKTTVFNLISGFLRPDHGEIRFAKRRLEGRRGDIVARSGLVRTFQTPRVLTRMSVLDNLLLAAQDQPGERLGLGWIMPRRVARREREIHARALEMLDLVRLLHVSDQYAGALSGGQRKLVEFARALMVMPRMILLDEPMAGVLPALVLQLLDHVQDLRDHRGVTVFLIEHDMDVVMSVSDRVIVMDEGRLIADGPPQAIQNDDRVIEAYLGPAAQSESSGKGPRETPRG